MKLRILPIFVAGTMLAIGPSSMSACGLTGSAARAGAACCKVCSAGKACGNSCIARSKACHKGKGCACDG